MKQQGPRKLQKIFEKCKPNGECLEWTGNFFRKKGRPNWLYPYLYHDNKVWRGNRLVLFLTTKQLPKELCALHTCDNTKCLNPKHLYWGTHKQNLADSYARNRRKIKTHCDKGHEITPENTYLKTRKRGAYKTCRICYLQYWRDYRAKRKAA